MANPAEIGNKIVVAAKNNIPQIEFTVTQSSEDKGIINVSRIFTSDHDDMTEPYPDFNDTPIQDFWSLSPD